MAALVQTFQGCNLNPTWQSLNQNWESYGDLQVTIAPDPSLCSEHFTLTDLEASKANVLIFSASASDYRLTDDEAAAVQEYANEGHNLVGTSLSFGTKHHINNNLATLFGLTPEAQWRSSGDSGSSFTYTLRKKNDLAKPLFAHLPNPYVSSTSGSCQRPDNRRWTTADLTGASFAGMNADHKSAITVFRPGAYSAVYIANTPEFQSTDEDLQFLYNAVIFGASAAVAP